MTSAPSAVARRAASARRSTLPSRSPTVVFNWPSAIRTTSGAYRPARGAPVLLEAADVHVVRLPHEVGTALPVPDHRSDEPLEVVACLIERPAVAADLGVLATLEVRGDALPDLRVLVAESAHVAGEAWRPIEDLVVQAVGLFRHEDVLLEGVANLVELFQDRRRPARDAPRRGRRQRLLEVHERVVQGLPALARRVQRSGQILVFKHGRTPYRRVYPASKGRVGYGAPHPRRYSCATGSQRSGRDSERSRWL